MRKHIEDLCLMAVYKVFKALTTTPAYFVFQQAMLLNKTSNENFNEKDLWNEKRE